MRIVLVAIFLIIFAVISIPLYFVAWLLGKKDEKLQVAFSQWIVRNGFHIIFVIAGAKVVCKGLENVPKDEAVMYIGNHRSYCDILAGYMTVPTLTGFVSKDDLAKVPCLSHWMRLLKCLFLNRKDPKEGMKMIMQGIQQIKQGFSIFIMPEGTRNKTEQNLLPFHQGSFRLATKTGCAIVPVAMKNTEKVIPNHFAWFHPTKVLVEYGEPVYPKDLSPEEQKQIASYMQGKMEEMLDNME